MPIVFEKFELGLVADTCKPQFLRAEKRVAQF